MWAVLLRLPVFLLAETAQHLPSLTSVHDLRNGTPALQGARDHIGRAQQRMAGLRTELQQASADVSVPGGDLIVTPALLDTLSRTHKVRACTFPECPASMQHESALGGMVPEHSSIAWGDVLNMQLNAGGNRYDLRLLYAGPASHWTGNASCRH